MTKKKTDKPKKKVTKKKTAKPEEKVAKKKRKRKPPATPPESMKFFVQYYRVNCANCRMSIYLHASSPKKAAQHITGRNEPEKRSASKMWRFINGRWLCGSCAENVRERDNLKTPKAHKEARNVEPNIR